MLVQIWHGHIICHRPFSDCLQPTRCNAQKIMQSSKVTANNCGSSSYSHVTKQNKTQTSPKSSHLLFSECFTCLTPAPFHHVIFHHYKSNKYCQNHNAENKTTLSFSSNSEPKAVGARVPKCFATRWYEVSGQERQYNTSKCSMVGKSMS